MEKLTATGLLIFGAAMCAMSLFLPPQGEVDSSVLMLFGQILVYAGSIFGVRVYIQDILRKRDK